MCNKNASSSKFYWGVACTLVGVVLIAINIIKLVSYSSTGVIVYKSKGLTFSGDTALTIVVFLSILGFVLVVSGVNCLKSGWGKGKEEKWSDHFDF